MSCWPVLNAATISQLDSAGEQAVDDRIVELQSRGVRFVIARPKLYMNKYVQPMELGKKIGTDNIFYSVHSAVEAILDREARNDILNNDK